MQKKILGIIFLILVRYKFLQSTDLITEPGNSLNTTLESPKSSFTCCLYHLNDLSQVLMKSINIK